MASDKKDVSGTHEAHKVLEVCDYCDMKSSVTLYCTVCSVMMCHICYNSTLGGRCCFISKKDVQHTAKHIMSLECSPSLLEERKKGKEKKEFPLTRTYISFSSIKGITCITEIMSPFESLANYVVQIKPKITKQSEIIMCDSEYDTLNYVHSDSEKNIYKDNVAKNILKNSPYTITCKISDFGVNVRECLDSIDYPPALINNVIADLTTTATGCRLKDITYVCVNSPYSIISSCGDNLTPIMILWEEGSQLLTTEGDLITKTKGMMLPMKDTTRVKYSGIDYVCSVTTYRI